MNSAIKSIVSIIPKPIRKAISHTIEQSKNKKLRAEILAYYENRQDSADPELLQALQYLKDHELSIFPYPFHDHYNPDDVAVLKDPDLGLPYVMHDHKRLYFKRSWNDATVRKSYSALLAEQDPASPHRYLTDTFSVRQDDVIVDAGSAEGNFSLSVIEQAKKIYLFETDTEWIEALEATFKPWREKVHIINKFISDVDNEHFIRLDTLFPPGQRVDFLKIDVDGAEAELLNGAEQLLSARSSMQLTICTYHKHDDEQLFIDLLEKKGFHVAPSNGYMLFFYDRLRPPYFRRALIRASR